MIFFFEKLFLKLSATGDYLRRIPQNVGMSSHWLDCAHTRCRATEYKFYQEGVARQHTTPVKCYQRLQGMRSIAIM